MRINNEIEKRNLILTLVLVWYLVGKRQIHLSYCESKTLSGRVVSTKSVIGNGQCKYGWVTTHGNPLAYMLTYAEDLDQIWGQTLSGRESTATLPPNTCVNVLFMATIILATFFWTSENKSNILDEFCC